MLGQAPGWAWELKRALWVEVQMQERPAGVPKLGSEALRSGDGDVSEIPASIEVRKGLRIPAHGHVEVLVPCGDADEMRF